MSPTELLFCGACVGWIACAICFMWIPSWRVIDIVRMSDNHLVQHMQECGEEWCYRHPELRSAYTQALEAGRAQAAKESASARYD